MKQHPQMQQLSLAITLIRRLPLAELRPWLIVMLMQKTAHRHNTYPEFTSTVHTNDMRP